jgi:hypothetical protein
MKLWKIGKFKFSYYVYINKNTKLNDLKFKEEIFEYFSINYNKMNEDEINEIIQKIGTFKILLPEVIELKNMLRNIVIIKEKLTAKSLKNLIWFLNDKVEDINTYQNDNFENDNIMDKDFNTVLEPLCKFIYENFEELDKEDLFLFFKLSLKLGNLTEDLIFYFFKLYENADNVENFSIEQESELIHALLNFIRNKKISNINSAKEYFANYLVKFKDELGELDGKRKLYCMPGVNLIRLYHLIIVILKDIDNDKESSVYVIKDEIKMIKAKIERLFLVNKLNPKNILNGNFVPEDNKFNEALMMLEYLSANNKF